jgi:two-component system nitrogen regulation response regulator GlnG
MPRLLLIDADCAITDLVRETLKSTDIDLAQTDSCEEGLKLIQEIDPEVVITCSSRSAGGAFDMLQSIRELNARLPVIFVNAGETWRFLSAEAKETVFDFVAPPIDPSDLVQRTEAALKAAHDMRSFVSYETVLRSERWDEAVVGRSPAMHAVFKAISRVSHSDAPVLIAGESGTGKTLVARAIYHHSRRKHRPLVRVDCAESEETLARELFGRDPRSPDDPIGMTRLDRAAGGTILLEHVERMPCPLQARFVEMLSVQSPKPGSVGNSRDVRIIAATSEPLEEAVGTRSFREDLLTCIDGLRVQLPPLRDRPDDIPHLAAYFLGRLATDAGQQSKSLSAIVTRALVCHGWPGNVRELEQVVRRAASFTAADTIRLGDLPADLLSAVGPDLLKPASPENGLVVADGTELNNLAALAKVFFQWARKDPQFLIIPAVERELIVHAMAETKGNQVQASKLLGITRATLRKRLKRLNIQRELYFR